MSIIKQVIIHCTDTPPWTKVNKSTLYRWHLGPKKHKDGSVTYLGVKYKSMKDAPLTPIHENFVGRGWSKYGYHILIHRNGKVEVITPIDDDNYLNNDELAWGCAGQNSISIHIALVGGKLQNNQSPKQLKKFDHLFTTSQFLSLQKFLKEYLAKNSYVKVAGHNQFTKRKLCPNFDVGKLMELYQLEKYYL